ncbi:MAG: amidophosphoribosyltransferase [Nanoarchaeota archaeon]|nr:amidophosphoribosyltransferase [Nanoarchaeota archaeon]MBU1004944.1 amidophosphoribosyltransferase [Nanoarchaeota archaeon]MBU1945610.1 amidophosphoribosyltransferase [Nanoarchaeota archaeon]
MSGIFGIVSNSNCISTLYYGTDYHSHLGTEYGGISIIDETGKPAKKIHNISNSQFKSKFYEGSDVVKSNMGIGVISDKDPQPLNFESRFGAFAICCAGLITNKQELVHELIKKGISFSEISHGEVNTTELIANLINQGESIIEGIEKMYEKIHGSISLLLLTPLGIYAARDKNGVTPLVIGEKDSEVAIASESCAFPNLGFKLKKFMEPGEILFISKKGIEAKKPGCSSNKICAFLWIYTGFPASSYEGINVETVRENCGKFLAKRDNVEVDVVGGVPDSGTAHAIGYAMESGKPYRRVLFKYTPGYGRSYTPPSQDVRDRIALMKLIANEGAVNGNRIVLCDDSIVRGTQLKNFTITKLKDAGVKETHIRPACPPLMFPCIYNLSTRSINELAARRAIRALEGKDMDDVSEYLDQNSEKYNKMIDWIAKDLGVTSLRYMLLDDMVQAIGLPKDKLCTYCWTGKGVQKSLSSF